MDFENVRSDSVLQYALEGMQQLFIYLFILVSQFSSTFFLYFYLHFLFSLGSSFFFVLHNTDTLSFIHSFIHKCVSW